MVKCKRPKTCQAITKTTGAKCKRCVGPAGTGGGKNAFCTACWQHKAKECHSKEAKRAAAQHRVYKTLGTSRSYKM